MTTPTTYEARLAEAQRACAARYEERDAFLSDDDVVDIAGEFTTSDIAGWHALIDAEFEALGDAEVSSTDADVIFGLADLLHPLDDWKRLQDDLFAWLTEGAQS